MLEEGFKKKSKICTHRKPIHDGVIGERVVLVKDGTPSSSCMHSGKESTVPKELLELTIEHINEWDNLMQKRYRQL